MARQEQELPVRREEERWLPSLFEDEWWNLSPAQWFRRMRDEMDRMMASLWGMPAPRELRPTMWTPTMEVTETDNEWIYRFDLPGVEPQDIDVSCSDDTLTVRAETRREEERRERGIYRAERRYGTFQRRVSLPRGATLDQVSANYRNGVLEIHVPKSPEARERVRHIPVQAGQPALAGAKGGEASTPLQQQGQPMPVQGQQR